MEKDFCILPDSELKEVTRQKPRLKTARETLRSAPRSGIMERCLRFRRGLRRLPVLALLMPVAAFAGTSGWTGYTGVAELTPTSHHRYTVRLNLTANPSDCPSKDTFYQDYSATGAQQMFQTLLEAVASSKRVKVFVTGRCELNGYAEISSVAILP